MSNIGKVIGVVSGKGGVGKTLVSSMLAVAMQRMGKNVGVLDADITGPSIPKAFGVHGKADACEFGIIPMKSKIGLDIMSINLLLENESDPVVWRGPVIAGVVKQFWTDVIWKDIDCLFVDMPPGTGDVPLTVFQSIPVDGIVIVTSPQELVSMIVEKAVKMAKLMNIPILGIIENMSYFECPDCGKRHSIYGESHIEEIAAQYDIPVLAKLPIDPQLAKLCDQGTIELFEGEWLTEAAEKIASMEK
jgi:Mrp family chromosome partitioning ATPase